MLPSSIPKPGRRLNPSSGPNGNGNMSSPSAASPGRGIMSNGLPYPDSLLTPGGRLVDAVNGVLNGLHHTANGLNGPEFTFFFIMVIAKDRLCYQTSVYSLVHTHSLTHGSRRLRFPKILPFPPPPTVLHLPVSYRLPRVRKPVTVSDRESRRESSSRGRMHPCFGFPKIQDFSQASQPTPSGCRFPRRSHHRRWLEFVDFLGSERRGGPR